MKLSYRNPIGILVLVILLAGGAFIVARASGAPRCGTITSDAAFGGNGQETFQPSQSAVTSCMSSQQESPLEQSLRFPHFQSAAASSH